MSIYTAAHEIHSTALVSATFTLIYHWALCRPSLNIIRKDHLGSSPVCRTSEVAPEPKVSQWHSVLPHFLSLSQVYKTTVREVVTRHKSNNTASMWNKPWVVVKSTFRWWFDKCWSICNATIACQIDWWSLVSELRVERVRGQDGTEERMLGKYQYPSTNQIFS